MRNLPRIACFHGGGSTSSIFSIQSAQLSELLANEFEFVFFDGPFDRSAGPGVLPAFRGHGPYHSWFTVDDTGQELPDGGGFGNRDENGISRVWKLIEAKGAGGDWVGVMGFSQGTRVAGGLLLDQQRRKAKGESIPREFDLRFGVMCMGGGAPMESEMSRAESSELVRTPTLHVHGLKDMFLMLGQHQLATYYDPKTATLYEVDYHHAMPWVRAEVDRFAELFRKTYMNTKG
ncbi:hypothetical protein EYZ11_006903 [Aspergillus tanneri]|uniref:Serine hydrolase domain-containing protein n=1 Tax=Aspergillus tanneri TaxID=1220188 RepID=A0A4S3JEB0_9EURO|nr:hypothetical protein EYZ11_006903 [Aspergillus tanneri]